MAARLYRVIVPVTDMDTAVAFYGAVLEIPGERVSPGRHYFNCSGTILAVFDPQADGDNRDAQPNPETIYIAVDELAAARERVSAAGANPGEIGRRPWGEESFYVADPFGNLLCFVAAGTEFIRG